MRCCQPHPIGRVRSDRSILDVRLSFDAPSEFGWERRERRPGRISSTCGRGWCWCERVT